MIGFIQDVIIEALQRNVDVKLFQPMKIRKLLTTFCKSHVLRLNLPKTLILIIFFNCIFGFTLLAMYRSSTDYDKFALRLNVIDLKRSYNDRLTLSEQPLNSDQSNNGLKNADRRLTSFNETGTPLVTLFTTFKVIESREQLNKNTLRLWASLRPVVRPVLFSTPDDDVTFLDYAKQLGWLVFEAPSLRRGYPIVRDMYTFIINHVTPTSLFVGYANSDIVFTADLNETLTYLSHVKWHQVEGQGLLLIGKRSDIYVNQLQHLKGPVTDSFLMSLSEEREYGGTYSLDYFISTADGYPFHKLPDFVVGKPGYDNYIVVKALDWNIRTIDCSKTITALHQIAGIPNFDGGWFSNNTCINRNLVDPFFPNRGATQCAQYFTKKGDLSIARDQYHRDRSVFLYKRTRRLSSCLNAPMVMSYPKYKTCEQIVEAKRKEMQKILENKLH